MQGIQGNFEGKVRPHTLGFKRRTLADGTLTYEREELGEVTVDVQGVSVRRVSGDSRRYVRITRGPKGDRDKIIGLVDKD